MIFAQSTQVRQELQRFPEGVAVRIPPYSRIIGATHILNVLPETLTTTSSFNLYVIEEEAVKVPLSPFRLTYSDLAIAPQSQSAAEGACDIAERYEALKVGDFDLKLYYALPHFHNLGTGFELSVYGGPRDGEMIFEQGGYGLDPFGRMFDPPVDLSEAKGLRSRCVYDNPRPEAVGWGIGDQEMCVMLGFADSPLAFAASVNETSDTDTSGDIPVTRGDCSVTAFPFSQTKEGGQPRPRQ